MQCRARDNEYQPYDDDYQPSVIVQTVATTRRKEHGKALGNETNFSAMPDLNLVPVSGQPGWLWPVTLRQIPDLLPQGGSGRLSSGTCCPCCRYIDRRSAL